MTRPPAEATRADGGTGLVLSVVVPVYNEVENVRPLIDHVVGALAGIGSWELVLVDDGSTDGSRDAIAAAAREDARVRPVWLARNCGQTAALLAGFRHARGPVIGMMDADLQNDASDFPTLLAALGEGHDAVVGYRAERRDGAVRRLSSRLANAVRNRLTGDRIRDTGCSLKLFRAEAIRSVPLFDGMHRFLPTLLRWHGFTVHEVPVAHHPRLRGESKYGIRNRLLRSSHDLMAVRWMRSRIIRLPLRDDGGGGGGA